MVARGRLTALRFVDTALISFADRHPKVCLSFVLELSFRVQISGYPITKKSPQKRTFFVMVARGRLAYFVAPPLRSLPAATGMLRLPFACGRTLLPEFGESRFPVKVWGKSSIQDYKKGI